MRAAFVESGRNAGLLAVSAVRTLFCYYTFRRILFASTSCVKTLRLLLHAQGSLEKLDLSTEDKEQYIDLRGFMVHDYSIFLYNPNLLAHERALAPAKTVCEASLVPECIRRCDFAFWIAATH